MADQKIGGGYIEISAQGVEKTQTQVEALEKDVYELADTYELLEHEMEKVEAVTNRLGRANQGFDFATLQIDASMKRTTETSKGFSASLGGMRQQITAASFAFQDFTSTSGDLGAKLNSVTNNLPMLLAGLGGLGQVVSITATGAVALYRNWDQIIRLFETKTPFPRATDDIDAMKRELEAARDAMAELESNSTVTAGELQKYNDLRTKTAAIEERIAAAEERQANAKKLKALRDVETTAQEKATAESLQKDLGGQQEVITRAVAAALNTENQRRRDGLEQLYSRYTTAANATTGPEQAKFLALLRGVKAEMAKVPRDEDRMAEATDIVAKAIIKGDLRAVRQLENAAIDRPDLFTPEQKAAIHRGAEAETPEKKKAREAAAKADADAQKKANDALIDALHKQGQEGERVGLAGARQAAKEKGADRAAALKAANAVNQQNAAAAKAQSGLQARAEQMIAAAAAAGRVRLDGEGKLSMGDFSHLSQMIAKELQRQNPGANPFMAASIANQIAANAEADVGKRMAAMGGQQLTNQQKLLTIATQLDADLARQQQQLLRQGREIDALSRNVATRQRTALSRPGG